MSGIRLICPHCGHDGTRETARPPLESYGFNYLVDDVLCREVRGYDENRRVWLSSGLKYQGSAGTNPRVECRACWQTFPVPEGTTWVVAPEQPAGTAETGESDQPKTPADAAGDMRGAAESLAQNLAALLRGTVEESLRLTATQIAGLETRIGETAVSVSSLLEDLASLHAQTGALSEAQQQLQSRVVNIETVSRPQEETLRHIGERLEVISGVLEESRRQREDQSQAILNLEEQGRQLWQPVSRAHDLLKERVESLDGRLREEVEAASRFSTICEQLQEGQQALQKRLDAQAEAIRAFHVVAEERAGRTEELRAAAQKLEEIAQALGKIEPLPGEL